MKIFWVLLLGGLTTNLQAEFTNLPAIPKGYCGTFYLHEQITDGKVERISAAKRFAKIEGTQVVFEGGEKLKVEGASGLVDGDTIMVTFTNRDFFWSVARIGPQLHITKTEREPGGELRYPAIYFVSRTPAAVPKVTYSPAQIREIFFLLGMNNEYMGKRAGRSNMFYSSEGAKEAVYDRHVERLQGELGLKSPAEVGLVVDSFYKRGGASCGIGDVIYTISEDAFDGFGEEAALGYLAGAAVRHRYEESFNLANAPQQADVLAWLLVRHDCRDVRVCADYGLVPRSYEVQYKPSPAIQKLIEEAVAERERNGLPVLRKPDSAPQPVRNSP